MFKNIKTNPHPVRKYSTFPNVSVFTYDKPGGGL